MLLRTADKRVNKPFSRFRDDYEDKMERTNLAMSTLLASLNQSVVDFITELDQSFNSQGNTSQHNTLIMIVRIVNRRLHKSNISSTHLDT